MKKEKNNKPPKELPLGFVDRQEKELLVRDFIISNIKEVMIKYGFNTLKHQVLSTQKVLENSYQIKIGRMKEFFHFKTKINGYLSDMI